MVNHCIKTEIVKLVSSLVLLSNVYLSWESNTNLYLLMHINMLLCKNVRQLWLHLRYDQETNKVGSMLQLLFALANSEKYITVYFFVPLAAIYTTGQNKSENTFSKVLLSLLTLSLSWLDFTTFSLNAHKSLWPCLLSMLSVHSRLYIQLAINKTCLAYFLDLTAE